MIKISKKGWKNSISEGPRNRVPKGPFLQDLGEVGFRTFVEMVWDRSEDNRQESAVLRSGL